MSKEEIESLGAHRKLMNKVSKPIGIEDTKHAEPDELESILRLAMGTKEPKLPKSVLGITEHLRGSISDAPLCGTDRLAAAFGVTVANEGKRFLIKASNTEVIRLKEDEAHSSKCLFEMACVKIAQELEGGRIIYPTFNLHSRRSYIDALKPYGEAVKDHYMAYLEKLGQEPEEEVVQSISIEELIDDETGDTRLEKLEAGKSYTTGEPDRSKLKVLLEHCEKSQISLRFSVARVWVANEFVKNHPRLKIISGSSSPSIVAYEANKRHPVYPLVPGPECKEELTKLINRIKGWIASNTIVYTPVSLSAPVGNTKGSSKTTLIFQAMLSDKKPNESQFDAIPKHVKEVYYEAVLAGAGGAKAVLEKHNIVSSNAAIYVQDHMAKKTLPPAVLSTVQKVTNSLPSPNARLILKYVHFVMANKEIYEGKESIISRLPKDPWLAAVNMICRHLEKYGLQEAVRAEGGDIYPKKWMISKGKSVPALETKKKPTAKANSRKPDVPNGSGLQKRGGGEVGHPKTGGRNFGRQQRALPGLKTFPPRGKAGLPGVVMPGKTLSDHQLVTLAQNAGQAAVQAVLVAQQQPPNFTYQSCDWSEEAQTSTGIF